ncbi:LOW QUALITY PROTEIN: hypothetical protein ACHAWO_001712 [Cyclotella atomus]|uniref:Uncharacterized protein n=1 Tax=Cyclotella atomus TaxID=382360 RepID=A0ABD3PSX7_9STRA
MQLAADFTEHGPTDTNIIAYTKLDTEIIELINKTSRPKKVRIYEIPRPCTSGTAPYAVQMSSQLQTLSPTIARELHKLSKKARG